MDSYNCYTNCVLRIRLRYDVCTNSYIFYVIFVPIRTFFIQIVLYQFIQQYSQLAVPAPPVGSILAPD